MTSANSFQFRMGGALPGTVNRTHPADIEPNLADGTSPPTAFGLLGVRSSTGTIRNVTTGDTATSGLGYGVVVRPYPVQQPTASSNFAPATYNSGAPQAGVPLDLLVGGYIAVQVNSNPTGIVNGSPVYIWSAGASGAHVQGGFEGTNPSGNGFQLAGAYFRGPADSNGLTEIKLRPTP